MAEQHYRATLFTTSYPFVSDQFGRTVILGQLDARHPKGQSTPAHEAVTEPQMYFCENVLPTSYGIQSCGYTLHTPAAEGETDFVNCIALRDIQDRKAYLGVTASGKFFVARDPYTNWVLVRTIAEGGDRLITVATVQGDTYVYVSQVGCYRFNFDTNTLDLQSLNALDPSAILGITSSGGYMIAWSESVVAWSSTSDPTDFDPNEGLVTGAGSASLQEASGSIVVCIKSQTGFLVFCSGNVVSATAANSFDFPFNFRELVNSGGLEDILHVDYLSRSGSSYAYTTNGLQLIDVQRAQPIFIELTDFLAGRVFEAYNYSTDQIELTQLEATMPKTLRTVAARFLVISYSLPSSPQFTHAVVYDGYLKRFGKLRIDHTLPLDLNLQELGSDQQRNSIGFLKADGEVWRIDLSYGAGTAQSVALLGKYQLFRARNLQLNTVSFEGAMPSGFSTKLLTSLDGKTREPKQLVEIASGEGYKEFGCSYVGENHTLAILGNFSLNTVILKVTTHGRR